MEKVGLARKDNYNVLCAKLVINSPIARRRRLKVLHTDTATVKSLLVFARIVLIIRVSQSLITIHWTTGITISNLFTRGRALRSRGMAVVHFPQGLKLFDRDSGQILN